MMPLQFCDFSDVPLQFIYLQPCHYNSLSTCLMPFSAAAATSGPPAGRRTHTILPYGRLCPSPTRIEPEPSRGCLARPHTQPASPVLPRRRRRAPQVLSCAGLKPSMRGNGISMRASSGSTSAGVVSQGNHVRLEDCPFCRCRLICIRSKQPDTYNELFYKCPNNVKVSLLRFCCVCADFGGS